MKPLWGSHPPALDASESSAVHKRAVRRMSVKACFVVWGLGLERLVRVQGLGFTAYGSGSGVEGLNKGL